MKYIITAFFMLLINAQYAQTLAGKVVDNFGEPLVDVAIFNKTTGSHTHSNESGTYGLVKTSVNDSVYFSSLGYQTVLVVVKASDLSAAKLVTMNEASISLGQVVLVSEVNALSRLVDVDIKTNPVKSSQEILRKVPGLIIGQHAGGGKAEQIFLRGFDIDHGTDISINVDGLPVNMVSHAHGQGYSDLHFVIPETIEDINFGKGPYYADHGDFTTAGYVDLHRRKKLDDNLISLEAGQFSTMRFMGMLKVLESQKSNAYIASELYLTDGPFDSPQDFNRVNIMGRYTYAVADDEELMFTASHFQSRWNASGQIPQRAIDEGLIDRFGAIDDTEGGETSRTNILVNHVKMLDENRTIKSKAYVSQYNFDLYSNFTFYLYDPVNGDQIHQKENRVIVGAESIFERENLNLGRGSFEYQAGGGFRYDNVDDVELSHTVNRKEILEQLAFGDVDEVNAYGFFSAEYRIGKWAFNPSVRLDYFQFQYMNALSETYDDKSEDKVAISPKLNTIYSINSNWQLFLKTGLGFHSNDARVVVANKGYEILPTTYGMDLGTIVKPLDKLALNATLWWLYLDQEFVYVGDAAVVEPSGQTRRLGLDIGARYQALPWLYVYADANFAKGRSVGAPKGEDYIPLAPDFTTAGGIMVDNLGKFSGALTYRYIDDRPANEDDSIVAEGYFVTDFNINYTWKNWTYGIIIENLFDTEWNETQFATESRLYNEPKPIEEIHFTPGTPFYLRGKVSVQF
ncbi:TonB-dependent receptor [Galbibacter pacificus]|uniref:TonB-dependent receptor plug domain-containing protein n=1 Tax=Galbibacter pacificus TaxID=2996052 RepID=A0ABT6FSV6_9FLAO|nr:TonB-dependent receptor plug domain-containing protein [Galbibacter pacificus]MDG3582551.1 TonB-dependent receptor plug domain-containing protein [Galbibacter pacificus]MDG3586330.1 TonB-dependent receptor plug domain-containing protein [Galbibacter pacificus]